VQYFHRLLVQPISVQQICTYIHLLMCIMILLPLTGFIFQSIRVKWGNEYIYDLKNESTHTHTHIGMFLMTIDRIWIGNLIYWTLTIRIMFSQLYTVTTLHIKSSQFVMFSLGVAWWWISTMSFASLLTFLPACYCITTDPLLQLSYL
jgi:hypothetical protein